MQDALRIDTPDSGVLFDNMAIANRSTLPRGHFIQPRIEAELAFMLNAPLQGREVDRGEVLSATEYVCPSLEILDTRILHADPATGASRTICDTISDNAANAGFVLDVRIDPGGVDLRCIGAIVRHNGIVEETGLGAGVLGDPVLGIVWLARRLADYAGGLAAGDVVLPGSFIRPVEAPSGASFVADFGPYGDVCCDFD